jgi:hypothetical protein
VAPDTGLAKLLVLLLLLLPVPLLLLLLVLLASVLEVRVSWAAAASCMVRT